jgi:hypothetical protein
MSCVFCHHLALHNFLALFLQQPWALDHQQNGKAGDQWVACRTEEQIKKKLRRVIAKDSLNEL